MVTGYRLHLHLTYLAHPNQNLSDRQRAYPNRKVYDKDKREKIKVKIPERYLLKINSDRAQAAQRGAAASPLKEAEGR